MTPEQAKKHVNQRYAELSENNPTWSRVKISNLILQELEKECNFTLTTPTGHSIVAVNEDAHGILYQVSDLMR